MIVSHSNETIRTLCDRVIWLNEGLIKMDGKPEEVLEAYEDYMSKLDDVPLKKTKKAEKEEEIMRLVAEEDKALAQEKDGQEAQGSIPDKGSGD